MALPNLNLDDRTFEQLFNELQRRIPAYTPEWTDFNESDPGITLLQLFAYLSEIIIYRLNQVPDKNYRAFLGLVGIDLMLPAPAVAELTFKLSTNTLPTAVPIPAGTEVQLAASPSGGPIIFETAEAILAVGLSLKQVQVFDGALYSVIPEDHRAPGIAFAPFGAQPNAGAALYLGFDGAFPTLPPGHHRFVIHAAPPPGVAPVVQGVIGQPVPPQPPVVGVWEYYAGNPEAWPALSLASDSTNGLSQDGAVEFDAPAAGQHVPTVWGALQNSSDSLYWIRYRIESLRGNGYESQPMLEDILLNTVQAKNEVTETDEVLGASNGLPNQTFTLANSPVLPKDASVDGIIQVDEIGDGSFVTWKEVSDFAAYGQSDQVYTIDLSTGLISFGDGIHGKIPAAVPRDPSSQFSANRPNIKAVSYRWGGGSAGNAGANTITSLNTAIPYLDSVTNLRPAVGGQDQEQVADASTRASAILRSQNRAVTADDFADLAKMTPGVRIVRATAIPLYNPNIIPGQALVAAGSAPVSTQVPLPGVVTVVVIPYSDLPQPIPSKATLQLVADYLDKHRLITTELCVTAPNYRSVQVVVKVIADPRVPIQKVSQDLTNKLLSYFHPVTGGEDGKGWGFGASIYFSETTRIILLTPGVVRIVPESLKILVDGKLQATDILFGPTDMVYSTQHVVSVSYS
jgi:predicted phage baseplate assembly protein